MRGETRNGHKSKRSSKKELVKLFPIFLTQKNDVESTTKTPPTALTEHSIAPFSDSTENNEGRTESMGAKPPLEEVSLSESKQVLLPEQPDICKKSKGNKETVAFIGKHTYSTRSKLRKNMIEKCSDPCKLDRSSKDVDSSDQKLNILVMQIVNEERGINIVSDEVDIMAHGMDNREQSQKTNFNTVKPRVNFHKLPENKSFNSSSVSNVMHEGIAIKKRQKTRKTRKSFKTEAMKLFPIFLSKHNIIESISNNLPPGVEEKHVLYASDLSPNNEMGANPLSVKKNTKRISVSVSKPLSPIICKKSKRNKDTSIENLAETTNHIYSTRSKKRKVLIEEGDDSSSHGSSVNAIKLDDQKCIQETRILNVKSDEREITTITNDVDIVLEIVKDKSEKTDLITDNHNDCEATSGPSPVSNTQDKFSYSKELIPFPLMTHCEYYIYPEIIMIDEINSSDSFYESPMCNGILGLIDANSISYLKESKCCKNIVANVPLDTSNTCYEIDDNGQTDSSITHDTDMLWIDRLEDFNLTEYQNNSAIKVLKSWLTEWRSKCLQERSNNNFDNSSDSEDLDDMEKAYIITGHTGSGKTSIIYSLASELGYTVLEVNASSDRSSRHITSQLQEAFQSYHMSNIDCKTDSDKSNSILLFDSKKGSDSKNEISDCETKITLPSSKGQRGMKSFLIPVDGGISYPKKVKDIRNFFSGNTKPNQTAGNDHIKGINNNKSSKNKEFSNSQNVTNSNKPVDHIDADKPNEGNKKVAKISSLTLILFDDVDVIFDEDDGFWFAVNMFLKTSKKPVLFTASRNIEIICSKIMTNVEILNFDKAAESIALQSISSICETNLKVIPSNLNAFVINFMNDIRRCLLHLQFWYENIEFKSPHKLSSGFTEFSSGNSIKQSKHFIRSSCSDLNHLQKIFSDNNFMLFVTDIMEHHSYGIDLLYDALYDILNIAGKNDSSSLLQGVAQKFEIQEDNSVGTEKKCTDTASNNSMEMCKCNPDNVLSLMVSILDHFSFANMLKDQIRAHSLLWQSTAERFVKWSSGAPTCNDGVSVFLTSFGLELISLLNILCMRQGKFMYQSLKINCNYTFEPCQISKAFERKIELISSAIPISQKLYGKSHLLDYLDAVSSICRCENNRKLDKDKRGGRFLHYFDSITLFLNPMDFI